MNGCRNQSATRSLLRARSADGGTMSSRTAPGFDGPDDPHAESEGNEGIVADENGSMKKDKIMLYLPPDLVERLKIRAVKEKKSNSKLAEEALSSFLRQN